MADEAKIADVAAPAESFGTDEIRVGKVPIIDDVSMTAHAAELY